MYISLSSLFVSFLSSRVGFALLDESQFSTTSDYVPIHNSSNSESNLHRRLFRDYVKDALPSRVEIILLKCAFHLTNLNSFDSRGQVLTVSGWFHFQWSDTRLSWNTSEYEELNYIFVPQSKIWKPDLIPEKDAAHVGPLGYDEQYALVYSSGFVDWSPSGIFNLPCQLDLSKFPFDTQVCNFFVTSWTHTRKELLLNYTTAVGLDNYLDNEEWKLTNSVMNSYNTYNTYVGFNVVLTFLRKPHFYTLVLIFPAALSSSLNSLVFLLPPESGERVTLSITSFLTFTIFISYISEMVPQNADNVPLVAVLLVLQSTVSVVSLACNILVVRMEYTKHSRVLRWAKHFMCKNNKNFPAESVSFQREKSNSIRCTDNGDPCVDLADNCKSSVETVPIGCDAKEIIRRVDNMLCLGFFFASLLLFLGFMVVLVY